MKDIFEEYGCICGCLICLIAIGIYAGLLILLGWIFSLLWNFAMPHIWADAPMINIWIGTAIVVMTRMLFGQVVTQKTSK